MLIVTGGVKNQESFYQDLETWRRAGGAQFAAARATGGGRKTPAAAAASKPGPEGTGFLSSLLFFPAWEISPSDAKLPHADIISERLQTLLALEQFQRAAAASASAPVVVTTAAALRQPTFRPDHFAARTRTVTRGDRLDPADLIQWLEEQSYEPETQVNQKGQIALRGGILDVYPLQSPWPVRLEFFGDELESLRFFDPHTQISREQIEAITLPPGGELGILRREAIRPLASLVDYFTCPSIFLLSEVEEIDAPLAVQAEPTADQAPFEIPWRTIEEKMREPGNAIISLDEEEPAHLSIDGALPARGKPESDLPSEDCPIAISSLDPFRPVLDRAQDPQVADSSRREFFAQIHRWLRQGNAVHVFCNNEGERQRFEEIWEEYGAGLSSHQVTVEPGKSEPALPAPVLDIGSLGRGFLWPEAKLVVITDSEIFGRYRIQRARRLKSPHAAAARSAFEIDFTHLENGDYVVHVQHGIGKFIGLDILPPSPRENRAAENPSGAGGQECLVIEYASSDPAHPPPKLYVPVSEAHLVSKYVGTGKIRPALNTLGGGRWLKTKALAEKAIRDLAGELLSIQAARATQPGFSFPPDAPWQREFEAAFLYEETPDQLRAIAETKHDLETARPMDRLICGDVGFGKTEVAIRAAFKAVLGGKQVAVLVPTTVLAQQHFNTFRERMADYPMRIELLSRFRTPREQKRIIRQLAEGAIDIIIGTHRLVQGDVAFKDLGLVVIDEEQRFGVLQKEKFKKLRQLVDVLTLSATPIPRTLYLALTGARDMSTIETPPHDRLPVETIITPFDERIIRDAIQRELARQGQIFFLHNRVTDIDAVGRRLAQLVPSARIVIGHGQMPSDELEGVMTRFVNGEADLLLSTTIIESGLDIPNANTIIIDRADRFGLSDLYQLRGRVGRYKHQAYAYLLLPRHAGLIADARKRISAIKQYSSLGSGFKIAMRDLEIRGAGNLLGPEQSGHIAAVGFELYCQLLKQSVSILKGEKVRPRVEVALRLDFLAFSPEESPRPEPGASRRTQGPEEESEPAEFGSPLPAPLRTIAYLPLNYIEAAQARIEIYRKIAQITDKASAEALRQELRDRFGPLPAAVELLIQVMQLKVLAAEKRVTMMETRGDKLMLTRNQDYIMVGGRFPRLAKREAKDRLQEIKKVLLALHG